MFRKFLNKIKGSPPKMVLTDEIESLLCVDNGIVKINRLLANLAPPNDDPKYAEESRAFQTLMNDLISFGMWIWLGKTKSEVFELRRSYFKENPWELSVLLAIATKKKCAVVDFSKFEYFNVSKLTFDQDYIDLLMEVNNSLVSEMKSPPKFPW